MKKTRSSGRPTTATAAETPKARPGRQLKKPKVEEGELTEDNDTQRILPPPASSESSTKRRAKGKGKGIDASTFLPRLSSKWKVGAHVSAAGGVENAVTNAAAIGANAFALFLKSQRKWESPPMKEESVKLFKERMKEFGYDTQYVLPHGSYLINLGNPDAEKRMKSYDCFIDDLKRCEALGLRYYNFHPGSTVGNATTQESIRLIAECLNDAHKATKLVVTVLENMAGAGNIIGSTFEDIAGIIGLVEDRARVGVCFDTCHAHAAGYDITSKSGWDATMTQFDEKIGLKYLCGMHMNDSKTPLGSKRDRHENIGMGTLGLPAFKNMLNDPRTQDIPLILETPSFEKPTEVWGTEIRVLNALSGIDETGDDAKNTVEELVDEVKAAVKLVDIKAKGAKAKPGKRKRKESEESEDDEECDH